jgi:hypothetical protein
MCPLLCVVEACNKPSVVTIEDGPHPVAAIAKWDFLGTRLHGNLF